MWQKNFWNVTTSDLRFTMLSKAGRWFTLEIILSPGKGLSIALKTYAEPGPTKKEKSGG